VLLQFPVNRSGDLSYDAILNYQTIDGTALAGTDYVAASGTITVPAYSTDLTIPVTLAPDTGRTPSVTFQLQLRATGVGPVPHFSPQTTFGTGPLPFSVAYADLNGDGKQDMIVANQGNGNSVSVLLNTTVPGASFPTFALQQTFTAGAGPISVAVADINGDGKPDLVVANLGDIYNPNEISTVSVLLNTTASGSSSLSFAVQQSFQVGRNARWISVGDLNGDGKPDLVVVNENGNTVSVLLNTTTTGAILPTFAVQQTFATGTLPQSATIADINGDGIPDIVVGNSVGSSISVLINTTTPGAGTLSFAPQQTFATGVFPFSVIASAINDDGKPDIIVANDDSKSVSVLLNETSPGANTASFSAQQSFSVGNSPTSVAAVDVNGDGKPDLITANQGDNTVSVLLNTTLPGAAISNFASQITFTVGGSPTAVTGVDLNGDGKPDLVVADQVDQDISVLFNTTSAPTASLSFSSQQPFTTGMTANSVTTADINGDGIPDVVVANINDNSVSVLLNSTATGAQVPMLTTQKTFAAGAGAYAVTTADINGDGRPDVVVANYMAGSVSVFLNTTVPGAAAASLAAQQTFAVGGNPTSVATADLNGDGKPDLIISNDADNTVSVLLNTTAPGAATPNFAVQHTFATGTNPVSVTTADVNGDGKPDVIVANQGFQLVSVLLNTTAPGAATPSFAAQQTFAATVPPFGLPFSVTTADVNGDGLPDLIVADNSSSNTVSVLLNTTPPGASTVSFAAQQTFYAGFSPESVITADVDGDGRPDLIVADTSANVALLLNTTPTGSATPQFAAARLFATAAPSRWVATADINGDGKPDLIIANSNGNSVSLLLNTQYAVVFSHTPVAGTIVHDYIFADGFDP